MLIRILLVGLLALLPGVALAAPQVGAPAPDFNFQGEDGATYRLADYIAPEVASKVTSEVRRKGVVIAWFPKAFTAG